MKRKSGFELTDKYRRDEWYNEVYLHESDQVDIITVHGSSYELSEYCERIGITSDELISLIPEANKTYTTTLK